jgi:hypothetical protein
LGCRNYTIFISKSGETTRNSEERERTLLPQAKTGPIVMLTNRVCYQRAHKQTNEGRNVNCDPRPKNNKVTAM